MKRLIFSLFAFVLSVAPLIAEDKDSAPIEFAELEYDFGTIKADSSPVVHEYEFTNTGDMPLTVISASASCGCTRPKYTHKPVKPGSKGKITVTFLPKGQRGYIGKNVNVKYKTADKKTHKATLKITGYVTPE